MTFGTELEPFRFTKASRRLLRPVTERLGAMVCEDSDAEVKFQCLMALGRIADPISLPIMQKALDTYPDNPEPIVALGLYRNSSPVPRLLKLLENPEFEFKEEVVRTLGEIADPMAGKVLLQLLQDSDRMVRYYAAWALYRLGGRDVAQNLCRLLSDPDEWIVINVLEILSQLKETEAIPALVGQFEIAQDARLKAIIISSLSTFREPKLLHLFEEGLKSFDPRIQANAVEALASLKIPSLELKRKLKKFLTHTNNRVRANAAIALSAIEMEAVKAELEKMLTSPDVPTRRSAGYVLSKVQITNRDVMIDRLLVDSSYMVRKIALKASLVMETEVSTNRVLPLLKDKNPWVRKEAVECGRKISKFPVDPILELFKTEINPPVLESILDFIVDRRLNQAVSLIVAKIKGQPEDSLGKMISTLGHLQARESLFEIRKFLPPADEAIMSRFYVAMLLHGELNVFLELAQGLVGRPRDNDMLMWIKTAGEIGSFIQEPESFSEWLNKALIPEVQKDMEGMAGSAPPATSKPPDESVLRKCIELFHQERYDDAIPVLNQYRHWFPENQEALYYLASCHNRKGTVDESVLLLEELLRLNPGHVSGGLLLGQIFFQRKNWPTLATTFEKFRLHIPSTDRKAMSQVQGALGLAYFHQRKYQKALEMLQGAIAINPRDLSSVYHLALTFVALKNHGQATRILRTLQTNLPPNSQVLKNVEDLLQKIEEES